MDITTTQKLLLLAALGATLGVGWFLLWRKLTRIEALLSAIYAALSRAAQEPSPPARATRTLPPHRGKHRHPKAKHLRVIVSRP